MNNKFETISQVEKVEKEFVKMAEQERKLVETRFPLLFGLMATFGFVSVLYGFEKMIDKIDFLIENPAVMLLTGLFILFLTGAAYRKLN